MPEHVHTTFYIVRHGETDHNSARILQVRPAGYNATSSDEREREGAL